MESNKNKELKIKSFRVDEEIFEKFKQIALSNFGNQNQCLDALINLYEMENSKSSLVGRRLEIESFQDYLNKINQLFVTSLQLSQDAEARAKEEFLKQLSIKDTTIERLQLKEKENRTDMAENKEKLKISNYKVIELDKLNKELEKDKSTLAQLVSRNYELIEKNKIDMEKLNSYKSYKYDNDKIKKELEEKKQIIIALNQELNTKDSVVELLQKELDLNKKRMKELKEEVASYRALLDASRREHKKEIELLEGKYTKIIENEHKRLVELFNDKLDLERKTMELKIKTLEQEKNSLEFKLSKNNI